MVLFFGAGAERLQAEHGPSILMAQDPLACLIEKENFAAGRPRKLEVPRTQVPAPRKKRKSTESTASEHAEDFGQHVLEEIDDNDPRLCDFRYGSCSAVRKRIRSFTGPGGMKVGDFQKVINVSPVAYRGFMNRTGTWDGEGCDTYRKAMTYFAKRELIDLPTKKPQAKKQKTKAAMSSQQISELLDVTDIELPEERDDVPVPVYDTCNEIRKKISSVVEGKGIPKSVFVEALSRELPEDRQLNTGNLQYFLNQKGPKGGNTTALYYAAYKFFEKRRLKDGRSKTHLREEMEEIHCPFGVDREHGPKARFVGSVGKELILDDYARAQAVPV